MIDVKRPVILSRGDDEPLVRMSAPGLSLGLVFLSDLEFHSFTGSVPHRELKAGADPDINNAHRLEMIQAARDGKHFELVVKKARTYRQKKGQPNRRYLRFAADQLEAIAPTFAGQPFLVDHNTHEQDARKGTILTSELVDCGRGMWAFDMGFSVVKPDAVISVLDGTIDRFSIGWFNLGKLICTVHKMDIEDPKGCSCWPGDQVDVDGELRVVEYESQAAEGKELSSVNVPAVKGTSIQEYRAKLSAESHLTRRTKERKMAFTKLAAALALASISEADDDRAEVIVRGLRERAVSAELDAGTLRSENTRLITELATQTALASRAGADAIDRAIAGGYASGRLGYGKDTAGANVADPLESILRDFAGLKGCDALAAKLAAMTPRIPLGVTVITPDIRQPPPTEHAARKVPTDAEIASVAEQLGVPINDMRGRYGLAPIGAAQ